MFTPNSCNDKRTAAQTAIPVLHNYFWLIPALSHFTITSKSHSTFRTGPLDACTNHNTFSTLIYNWVGPQPRKSKIPTLNRLSASSDLGNGFCLHSALLLSQDESRKWLKQSTATIRFSQRRTVLYNFRIVLLVSLLLYISENTNSFVYATNTELKFTSYFLKELSSGPSPVGFRVNKLSIQGVCSERHTCSCSKTCSFTTRLRQI